MGAKVTDLAFDLDVLLVLGKGRRERALPFMRSTCCAMDGLAAVRRYLAHHRRCRSSSDGLGRPRFHHAPVAQAASIRARKASNSPSSAPHG